MDPMVAPGFFMRAVHETRKRPCRVQVNLHGSLAFTGKGHANGIVSQYLPKTAPSVAANLLPFLLAAAAIDGHPETFGEISAFPLTLCRQISFQQPSAHIPLRPLEPKISSVSRLPPVTFLPLPEYINFLVS